MSVQKKGGGGILPVKRPSPSKEDKIIPLPPPTVPLPPKLPGPVKKSPAKKPPTPAKKPPTPVKKPPTPPRAKPASEEVLPLPLPPKYEEVEPIPLPPPSKQDEAIPLPPFRNGETPKPVVLESKKGRAVELKSHQPPHCDKMLSIWGKHFFLVDTSPMGAGKTHTMYYEAQQIRFDYVIAVCPASVENTWKEWGETYGVNVVVITSYASLRSTKGHQPKHGLLKREDTESGATFSVTPLFQQMVESNAGCLLIVDEFQCVKNKNDQHMALKALCRYIYLRRGTSRIALLSGTPVDKEEQVVNMMQMLGIISHHRLYVTHKDEVLPELLGAQEMVDYANYCSPEKTKEVLAKMPFTQRNVHKVCYQLYIDVIQHSVVSAMPPPDIKVEIDVHNGYFNMSEGAAAALEKGINALHRATRYDPGTESYDSKEADWGAITTSLRAIEMAKVEVFVRLARQVLESNPKAKVTLGFNFQDPLNMALEALKEYKPLVLNGKVNKKKRPDIIKKYQEHNTKHRALGGNMEVMSLGIDLDDTHGEYTRYAFGSPNYLVMRSHQFSRRFHRVNTKSVAHVCFVYGKSPKGKEETSILNALARKTKVLKETLEMQVAHGMIFPGEYRKVVEEDAEVAEIKLEEPEESEDVDAVADALRGLALEAQPVMLALPLPPSQRAAPRGRTPSPPRGFSVENFVLAPTLRADKGN